MMASALPDGLAPVVESTRPMRRDRTGSSTTALPTAPTGSRRWVALFALADREEDYGIAWEHSPRRAWSRGLTEGDERVSEIRFGLQRIGALMEIPRLVRDQGARRMESSVRPLHGPDDVDDDRGVCLTPEGQEGTDMGGGMTSIRCSRLGRRLSRLRRPCPARLVNKSGRAQ